VVVVLLFARGKLEERRKERSVGKDAADSNSDSDSDSDPRSNDTYFQVDM